MVDDLLHCSFCGKSQKQVKKLIAGPGVYICDECVTLCDEIIEAEGGTPPVPRMPLSQREGSTQPASPGTHLVGVAEIADLLGVSRQRVAQLGLTYHDFPRPEAEIAAGRIWSRTAIETWVAAHPERRAGRTAKPESAVLDRFDAGAKAALAAAAEHARVRGHEAIGPIHVLLALAQDGASLPGRALSSLGITADALDRVCHALLGRKDPLASPPTGYTPQAVNLIESASLSAFGLGDRNVASEHLLLGIVRGPQGTDGLRIFGHLPPDLADVRDAVMQLRDEDARPAGLDDLTRRMDELAQDLDQLKRGR